MRTEAAATRLRARIVRVRYEKGNTDLIYATSPDLKGLLVAERTSEALENSISQAIADLYAACGEEVVVTRVEEADDEFHSWVAFPSEIAAKALTR